MTVLKIKGILSRPWWDQVHRGVAMLSMLVAITVYYQQKGILDRQDAFAKCIAEYNNAQAISGGARSQAIEDSLAAVDKSIHTVATATSRDQVAAALKQYETDRAAAIKKRAENPPPPPPSQVCG